MKAPLRRARQRHPASPPKLWLHHAAKTQRRYGCFSVLIFPAHTTWEWVFVTFSPVPRVRSSVLAPFWRRVTAGWRDARRAGSRCFNTHFLFPRRPIRESGLQGLAMAHVSPFVQRAPRVDKLLVFAERGRSCPPCLISRPGLLISRRGELADLMRAPANGGFCRGRAGIRAV